MTAFFTASSEVARWALPRFIDLDDQLEKLDTPAFREKGYYNRLNDLCNLLVQNIFAGSPSSFLLAAVLDFFFKVQQKKYLDSPITLSQFEWWLNHFSSLTEQEQSLLRAKIGGKNIPREEYQSFFPIGMGQCYSGSHFVVAHFSPDIDTMVASFWGWLDAFTARVGDGNHIWSLPGGPPESHVTDFFRERLGVHCFEQLARTTRSLTLSAIDLMTRKKVVQLNGEVAITHLFHGKGDEAILYVNDKGCYLGDWRSCDVEPVRQLLQTVKSILRWFQSSLQLGVISLFARTTLQKEEVLSFIQALFAKKIHQTPAVKELNTAEISRLETFFSEVIGLKEGFQSSFSDFNTALSLQGVQGLALIETRVKKVDESTLFDKQGLFLDLRPELFRQLEVLFQQLDRSIAKALHYLDRLRIAVTIKQSVLGIASPYVTLASDVEELRIKMKGLTYLPIVAVERGHLLPLGVVKAETLERSVLGTASLRDFCNREETKMASYLDVISIMDHHKSDLSTQRVPLALIGDAQSTNVLLAEECFKINDRYGSRGMTLDSVQRQINGLEAATSPSKAVRNRLSQRLYQRKLVLEKNNDFFIDQVRESMEYITFLYAILDDTDLLSKVTRRDVEVVVELLNRLTTLSTGVEQEVIDLDDIPLDRSFAKASAEKILKNEQMYLFYRDIYRFREEEILRNLALCVEDQPHNLFADTKEQNGCCRVGQTKLFLASFNAFSSVAPTIRQRWWTTALEAAKLHPEIDLHLHMVSTIASADDVHQGARESYPHRDELWFWVNPTQSGYDHLASFLSAFQFSEPMKNGEPSLQLTEQGEPYEEIFQRNFRSLTQIQKVSAPQSPPIAILSFTAGILNSRKTMVSPYLPHLVH